MKQDPLQRKAATSLGCKWDSKWSWVQARAIAAMQRACVQMHDGLSEERLKQNSMIFFICV
jgi:hypothetical protein